MIEQMTFGECLKYLLSTLDISISRLSRAINVDSSLANRWTNGKRIPAYHTPYIESIAEYLSKNIRNSIHEHCLNELFLHVCKDPAQIVCAKEKVHKVLLEAQGYSIECKKRDQREKHTQLKGGDQISKILTICQDSTTADVPRLNEVTDTGSIHDRLNANTVSFSENDKIIFGMKNILSAGISLLKKAVAQYPQTNRIIYVTYNNDFNSTSPFYTELKKWRELLLEAMNNGWYVLFVLRLNNNIDRALQFINFILPLFRTGRFQLYYFKKYGIRKTESEKFVVSGIGALSCYSTKPYQEVNCAFYLENKAAVEIFKDHFDLLISTTALPLIQYCAPQNHFEYSSFLSEADENPYNRFLFKSSFSVLTLPEHLYQKLLSRMNIPQSDKEKASVYYRRHLNTFLSNLQMYEYRDIYLTDAVNDLVKHRQYNFYSYAGLVRMDLEIQDVIDFLQNIMILLSTYDNYKIALLSNNIPPLSNSKNFYVLVKDKHIVLLESFIPETVEPEVRLSVTEPMIVKCFVDYFENIWEQIAPVNKDKQEMINWLQSQILNMQNILQSSL